MASESPNSFKSTRESMIDYKPLQERDNGGQKQQNDYFIQQQGQGVGSAGNQQSLSSPSDMSTMNKACLNRTNSSNLIQDESLINEIQKYPCLYDRTHPGYKKEDTCHQAWMQIREECVWIENSKFTYYALILVKISSPKIKLAGSSLNS